jgi:hypothetical protein
VAAALHLSLPPASELPSSLGLGPAGTAASGGADAARPVSPRSTARATEASKRRTLEEEAAESLQPGCVKLLHRWVVFLQQVGGGHSGGSPIKQRHTVVKRKGPSRAQAHSGGQSLDSACGTK